MKLDLVGIGYAVLMLISSGLMLIKLSKLFDNLFAASCVHLIISVSTHLHCLTQYNRLDFGLTTFVAPFVLLLWCGRSWYEYLSFSLALWAVSMIASPYMFKTDTLIDASSLYWADYLLLQLALLVVLYSLFERVFKELWVISDSSK